MFPGAVTLALYNPTAWEPYLSVSLLTRAYFKWISSTGSSFLLHFLVVMFVFQESPVWQWLVNRFNLALKRLVLHVRSFGVNSYFSRVETTIERTSLSWLVRGLESADDFLLFMMSTRTAACFNVSVGGEGAAIEEKRKSKQDYQIWGTGGKYYRRASQMIYRREMTVEKPAQINPKFKRISRFWKKPQAIEGCMLSSKLLMHPALAHSGGSRVPNTFPTCQMSRSPLFTRNAEIQPEICN